MRVDSPFNRFIPKGIKENLHWRAAVHHRIMESPSYADVIRDACSRDPLFFINGFGYTYDPRSSPFTKIPFILYPFQETAMLRLIRAIKERDILIEKSRDMGASWLCVTAIEWCWMFLKLQSFLFVSRVEDYVDKAGNPKALFWKFDFLLNNLPSWLKPIGYNENDHRRKLHVENPENGSVVDGESTTGRVARGDRRTAILLDEFAAVEQGHQVLSATRDATPCRIFNSTPEGTGNAFYDMSQTGIEKLKLHWSEHPIKSIGLYTADDDGRLNVIDKKGYPSGQFEAVLDGKLRSPWYDNECKRAANAQEIAQELDIDYLGSGYQFFSADLVRERIRGHARPPILVGDLDYDDETGEHTKFRENPNGNLKLWFLLNKDGNPPKDHKYSLGVDVSAGTGASNSAGCAWDIVTCEKSLEYVNPRIRPEALARQIFAIAKWLGDAFLIWESGGPGRQFGDRVIDLGYRNIYWRRSEEALSKKVTDIPGVAQTKETKILLLSVYRAAIEKGLAINRSKEALEETLEYVFGADNSVVHARSNSKTDPSGAKANHGDRAMADALGWKGIIERTRRRLPEKKKPEIPVGCLAWRQKMHKEAKQLSNRELDKSWR